MKKTLFWLTSSLFVLWLFSQTMSVFAQNQQLEIIPNKSLPTTTGQSGQKINAHDEIIDGTEWSVRDRYNKKAEEYSNDTGIQVVSGIMTWDTILDYGVKILQFLSQAGIAVWWIMFIYTGYKYIMSIIGGSEPSKELINNAIIGILVIIFSYAIMRLLTRTFLI